MKTSYSLAIAVVVLTAERCCWCSTTYSQRDSHNDPEDVLNNIASEFVFPEEREIENVFYDNVDDNFIFPEAASTIKISLVQGNETVTVMNNNEEYYAPDVTEMTTEEASATEPNRFIIDVPKRPCGQHMKRDKRGKCRHVL